MYEIITYVSGPHKERSWLQALFGRPAHEVYLLNPQLYMGTSGTLQSCVHNFGVFSIATKNSEDPEELERRVLETAREIFGHQRVIDRALISAQHVTFTVEHSEPSIED